MVGVELLVEDGDGERSQPLSTVRSAATFADVEALIGRVRERVAATSGAHLELEVQVWR